MKPAAKHAAEVIAHYLRLAARSRNLDDAVLVFSQVEGVMQGLIDEAVTRAVAAALPPNWTYSPNSEQPLGPTCARPFQDADGDSR